MRRVDDEAAAGPRDAGQLGREAPRRPRRARACPPRPRDRTRRRAKGRRSPSVLVHVRAHEAADGGHRFRGEVGGGPASARAAQQEADHAVVRAEVEAAQARPSGPGRAAISAYLRCLRTERRKRASAQGSAAGAAAATASATALRPQDDRRSHRLAQAQRATTPPPPAATGPRRRSRDGAPWASRTRARAPSARSRRRRRPRARPRPRTREGPRVPLHAALHLEEGSGHGVQAAPGRVVHEHGPRGHAAELAHQPAPGRDVREQAIGEHDVELAVGGGQALEAAGPEARPPVRRSRGARAWRRGRCCRTR